MEKGVAEPSLVVLTSAALLLGVPAAAALLLGFAFAVATRGVVAAEAGTWGKQVLQIAIVGLGLGLGAREVATAGPVALLSGAATVIIVLAAAWAAGGLLGVPAIPRWLTSAGAAICGGSAIAAVGASLRAPARDLTVALALVFGLNAVAVLAFPFIGQWLDLSQQQFGVWAALAVHDTASVVAAASAYGSDATDTAIVWKLARAIWIAPVAMWIAWRHHGERQGGAVPWFIWGFLAAAVLRTVFGEPVAFDVAATWAKRALVAAILLIGASWYPRMFQEVRGNVVVQAALVWCVLAATSLAAVIQFV